MRLIAITAAGAAFLAFTNPEGRLVRIRLDRSRLAAVAPSIAAGAATFVIGVGLTGNPTLAGALAAFATMVPGSIRATRRRKEAAAAAAAWPDFLAILRGRISAGESVPEATLVAAARIAGPFASLADSLRHHRNTGFRSTVEEVRREWADPIADRVLTTLTTASDVGGSRVDAVLASLSRSVADEVRLRRSHEAALTQQRLTAAVALIAPWALLLVTIATNPQAAAAFSEPSGRMVIAIGFAGTLVGRFLTARAARLTEPARVLA